MEVHVFFGHPVTAIHGLRCRCLDPRLREPSPDPFASRNPASSGPARRIALGAGGSRRGRSGDPNPNTKHRGVSSVPWGSCRGRRRRRRCFGRIAAAGAAAAAAGIRAAWGPSAKCASSSSVIQVCLLQLVMNLILGVFTRIWEHE